MTTGIKRRWRVFRPVETVAVGTDWVIRVPGQTWWRVTSLVARLTASAVAANRVLTLTASDGESVWWAAEASKAQVATEAIDYCAHTGSVVNAAGSFTLGVGLPSGGLLLRSGDRLSAVTAGLDAGDQWSAIRLMIEEIPSGVTYFGDQGSPVPREVLDTYYD